MRQAANRTLAAMVVAFGFGAVSCTESSTQPVATEVVTEQPSVPAPRRVTSKSQTLRLRVLTTTQSLVRSVQSGEVPLRTSDGAAIGYETLSVISKIAVDGTVRGFARALLKGEQVETESTVTAAANDPALHDEYDFGYDATTGDVTLTIEYADGVGSVVFNAYRLAAAAAAAHSYRYPDTLPLAK